MKRSRNSRMRRPLRRKRARRTRTKALTRAAKRAVKNIVYKDKESKCVTTLISNLNNISETIPDYVDQILYLTSTPGVTDRGRIGNTIHATGCRVKYVFKYQFPNTAEYSTEPLTLHMFIIKCKNTWQLPSSHWFKSLDRGVNDPYVPLERESIDDGRRVFNTDYYTILKHKTVTLQPTADSPVKQWTGDFSVSLKRQEIKFDSNDTAGNGIADLNHIYMFYAYVYSGTGIQINTPVQYGARFAIYQYYKD